MRKTPALENSNSNQQLTNFDVASICRAKTAACIPEEWIVTATSRTTSEPARLIRNIVGTAEGCTAFRHNCFYYFLL